MAKIELKLSTEVRENFQIFLPQMAKNALKLPTMVRGKFTCLYEKIP